RQLSYPVLQARVSAALAALPRGLEPSPPGERFRQAVLSAMPDIEAMAVGGRFFAIGAQVGGSPHPGGSSWPAAGSVWPSGKSRPPAGGAVHLATLRRSRDSRFAHVGKMERAAPGGAGDEASDADRRARPSADPGRRPTSDRPA